MASEPQSEGASKSEARVDGGEKLYTIGAVSKLTGVGAVTLRAWERRYGLIQPERKESGHRLYTRSQIQQINRITALTRQGMRISQVRPGMLTTEAQPADDKAEDAWRDYLDGMIAAIAAFDEERLEEIYNGALSLHPVGRVTENLLTPLLTQLGQRWEAGRGTIAEEHFFVFYLRNKLGARYHHRRRTGDGPALLIAGLPGEHHEIGLLLFALAAHEAGYRVIPLGPDMPLSGLAGVALEKGCRAIVLCGVIEPSARTLDEDLPELVGLVAGAGILVLIGGPSSVSGYEAIQRAGAEALGPDIDRGLRRIAELFEPGKGEAAPDSE